MLDVDDLKNCLQGIEERLKIGPTLQSFLNGEEVRLLNEIMIFSDRVRKLIAEINPHSCNVRQLLGEFTPADTNLTFVCEYCDTEIPLMNNDPEFSYQMHKQSKAHIDAIDGFALLKDSRELNQKEISAEIIIPDGNKIHAAVSSSPKLVEDQELNDWLVIRDNGDEYCSHCDCNLPRNNPEIHSRGHRHRLNTELMKIFGPDIGPHRVLKQTKKRKPKRKQTIAKKQE